VINETIKLLSESGPNQPLYFTPKDAPQKILLDHGFKPLQRGPSRFFMA
jgi:hypothetical protein